MSNSSIKILRSGEIGKIPSVIEHGELAINYADGKLFYLNSANNISFIKNSDSFATINVNNNLIIAGSSTDILNINSNNGIELNSVNKTITINLQTIDSINSNSTMAASANSVNTINQNFISHDTNYTIHNKIISVNSANGSVLIDSFSKNEYRTAEYNIQGKNENDIHIGKAILCHNDIELFYMEPYEMKSNDITLYTFDASFNNDTINVYLNVSVSNTNFKISRTIIPA